MAGKTIVALYDDFEAATRAVRALEESGFNPHDMSLIANNVESDEASGRRDRIVGSVSQDTATAAPEGAGTGAAIGALLGGGASLLAAAGAFAIPGIGPVLAAGPLAAALAGAGVGAAAGGLIGGLVGLGVPDEEAQRYAEAVRRGGAIVTLKADGADAVERATKILERHEPADLAKRSTEWRRAGWKRFEPAGRPLSARSIHDEREHWRVAPTGETGTRETGTGEVSEAAAGQHRPQSRDDVARSEPGSTGNVGGGMGDRTEPHRAEPDKAGAGREDRIGDEVRDMHQRSIIEAEAKTAEMRGGPLPTAMSGMFGSVEGGPRRDAPQPQEEPLKRQADTGAPRVRAYTSDGVPLRQAIDRAAAGDKPQGAEGSDPLAGHSRERS
jgi:hypothetical protein